MKCWFSVMNCTATLGAGRVPDGNENEMLPIRCDEFWRGYYSIEGVEWNRVPNIIGLTSVLPGGGSVEQRLL
jgi:hypothetical protein